MTTKTMFLTSLVPGLFTSIGTYELMRDRGAPTLNSSGEGESHKEGEVSEKKEESHTADSTPKEKSTIPEATATNESKEAQNQTYSQYLTSKNLTLVDASTPVETLKNILLHRMFPHYRKAFSFTPGQMFEGSPEINFNGEDKEVNGKTLYILKKNTDQEAESLRSSCVAALNKPIKGNEDADIYRLKAWCTIPTISDVLVRHKFELPKTDDQWKAILQSE